MQIAFTMLQRLRKSSYGYSVISLPRTFGVTGVFRGWMLKKPVQQGRRRARTGGVPSGVRWGLLWA